jgi:hypothetical protein
MTALPLQQKSYIRENMIGYSKWFNCNLKCVIVAFRTFLICGNLAAGFITLARGKATNLILLGIDQGEQIAG